MSQTLDLLVVGGGPAGVAAVLRARELGLSVLLVEADDIMRRIRDYSKDKLILPGFGGGDRMPFPEAGPWISRLPFEPIDKDDLVATWKSVLQEAGVAVRVGVELTGLEEGPDGTLRAKAFDHRQRKEGFYLTRHMALSLGRGVPRRFDIPGETESIPLRLEDPAHYVGSSACVIGGGTSAAEAVIAISNAKADAGDATPVVWSYRGDRLPRVSKALAEVFFEAYAGNGNIRYRPLSEPLMVMPGEDRTPHLALRIDRRRIAGRPVETTLLEFPVAHCLACIGEDLPEAFLNSLGIPMVVGGARGRKRMVVNSLLESRRSNVYLIGDILSQAYLRTEDFDADPSTFQEVRHRGNIKSALHDGVKVAEVVKQRLDGVADGDLVLPEINEEELPPPAHRVAVQPSRPTHPAPPEAAAQAAAQAAEGWLVQLLPGGVDGEEYPLVMGKELSLGRQDCDLTFPDDPLLAERHATLTLEGEGVVLRDQGAENGVFLQVPSRRKLELRNGDLLRVGRQFLVVQADEAGFQLVHYRADGSEAGSHRVSSGSTVFGRRADVTLDADDGALSRRHLAVTLEGERLLVKDLLSANGTFLRVVPERRLSHGDRFLVGQQRFAFSTQRDAVFDTPGPVPATSGRFTAAAAMASEAASGPESPAPEPVGDGPSVTFQPSGKICSVAPGQTVLDVAEANGIAITAECRSGICGSDPVRIVSGRENLQADPSDGEAETLEDLCGLEAGPCRLACMARIKGPVVVEIVR